MRKWSSTYVSLFDLGLDSLMAAGLLLRCSKRSVGALTLLLLAMLLAWMIWLAWRLIDCCQKVLLQHGMGWTSRKRHSWKRGGRPQWVYVEAPGEQFCSLVQVASWVLIS